MSKSRVTRLFIRSLAAVAAGTIVSVITVAIAIANDVFVMRGPDIVGIQGSALAWVLLAFGLVGIGLFVAGLIGGIVSWIGALLDTAQLERKTWFVGLLLLGIFNLGFFGMIAYVIAGPDRGSPLGAPRTAALAA